MQITIPATLVEAQASLTGIGALLTAKEWLRAALVFAFTEPDPGAKRTQTSDGNPSEVLSIKAFAALGIAGLTNRETVAEYRKAWEAAMADGAPEATPGATFEMPNLPWPPGIIDHRRGTHATTAEVVEGFKRVVRDPEKFNEIVASPEVADAIAERVAEHPATRWRADNQIKEHERREREERDPGPKPINIEHVLRTVTAALNEFWDREVQVGPDRRTFRQIVETVIENRHSPSMAWKMSPDLHLDDDLINALDAHIHRSQTIQNVTALPETAAALTESR